MKITMLTIGTQGSVGPLVSLGLGLKEAGHNVTIASNANFGPFVSSRGLAFAEIAGPAGGMVRAETVDRQFRSGGNPISYGLALRREAQGFSAKAKKVLDCALEVCRGSDALLYHDHMYAADSIAEYLGIPGFQAYNTPSTPTRYFPSFVALRPWNGPSLYNLSTHYLRDYVTCLPYRGILNSWRKSIGLPLIPISGPFQYLQRKGVPLLYSISPTVLPKPPDWQGPIHVTGYWHRFESSVGEIPAELEAFLQDGPKPICIGFGSMRYGNPAQLTQTVLDALRQTGQRAVFLTGWNGLIADNLPEEVFVCREAPHDLLYPRVAAAVNAGGIGTIMASLRANLPTLTVPFGGDNILWGWRCSQLGLGPKPLPVKDLSADTLALALRDLTANPLYRERAEAVGEQVRQEDGIGNAIDLFHQFMGRV